MIVKPRALLLGTSRGLYAARDTNYSAWSKVRGGLPNALVSDMDYDADADADLLVAGTLGRGAWKMTQAAETILPLDDSLDYDDASATYCDASHVRSVPPALFLGTVPPDGEWDTQSATTASARRSTVRSKTTSWTSIQRP